MFGIDKIIEDTYTSALDEIKKVVDATDFKAIADKLINKAEGFFKENSIPDDVIEAACKRLRTRFDIEDSNPDN